MSLMSDALAIHADRLKESAGEVVTYFRRGTSIEVTAVIGQSTFDEVASDGDVHVQTKTVDLLITPDDLRIDGAKIEPKRGDRVRRANGDVYDLLPGSRGASWSWNDGHQTHFRIHLTRRVKS